MDVICSLIKIEVIYNKLNFESKKVKPKIACVHFDEIYIMHFGDVIIRIQFQLVEI